MSHTLPLQWAASIEPEGNPASVISVRSEEGQILVRGQLSTGTRGWSLRGGAARKRSVITLQVTAVASDPIRAPDLEFHSYEAVITVRPAGRYRLRVTHACFTKGESGESFIRPVHEQSISVP